MFSLFIDVIFKFFYFQRQKSQKAFQPRKLASDFFEKNEALVACMAYFYAGASIHFYSRLKKLIFPKRN